MSLAVILVFGDTIEQIPCSLTSVALTCIEAMHDFLTNVFCPLGLTCEETIDYLLGLILINLLIDQEIN